MTANAIAQHHPAMVLVALAVFVAAIAIMGLLALKFGPGPRE